LHIAEHLEEEPMATGNLPNVVSEDEWLTARRQLLDREKRLTRERDTLAADRRRLPMVRIEKDYRFTGPDGEVGLLDLFENREQLLLQHMMFDPSWDEACSSCTAMADAMSEHIRAQLSRRSTTYVAVSRAPYPKLELWRKSRGWTFPWYSSFGTDFNYDFQVTLDPAVAEPNYNYHQADYTGEQPGISCFLRDGDQVFHTYSTFGRGVEVMMPVYSLLDLTALGRQEDWEEPKGRVAAAFAADPAIPDRA
jgi:predicted dithiol-disulfide oxidoreductase (DUF899 family)